MLWLTPRNQTLVKRFSEIVDVSEKEEKSGDEIAAEVIKNAGLTLV